MRREPRAAATEMCLSACDQSEYARADSGSRTAVALPDGRRKRLKRGVGVDLRAGARREGAAGGRREPRGRAPTRLARPRVAAAQTLARRLAQGVESSG